MADIEKTREGIGQFVLYIVIGALCIAALLYMLMNAKPKIAPTIKNSTSQSRLTYPLPVQGQIT